MNVLIYGLLLLLDVAVIRGITLKEKETSLRIVYSLMVLLLPLLGIACYYLLAAFRGKARQNERKRMFGSRCSLRRDQ